MRKIKSNSNQYSLLTGTDNKWVIQLLKYSHATHYTVMNDFVIVVSVICFEASTSMFTGQWSFGL